MTAAARRRALIDGRPIDDSSARALGEAAARGEFVWLDLEAPTEGEVAELHESLGIPRPPADASHDYWGRRPLLYGSDHSALVIAYGSPAEGLDADDLVEVHCLVSRRGMVTLHRQACPAVDEVMGLAPRWSGESAPAAALHRIVDHLVAGLVPLIADLDERGEDLTDLAIQDRTDGVQRRILEIRRRLGRLRRVVMPQRDLLGRLTDAEPDEVPGMTRELSRRFRGSYERMVRISDALDGARDSAQAATDVYLGTVNNRMNRVMEKLAVISGVFLPLSFLTGFFGQNFGWMVDHVGGPRWFVALGVVLPVAVIAGLLALFRRIRWL
ncbi:MAG: magnesium transporter CorA family protein [Thermoleophilia bacterium]